MPSLKNRAIKGAIWTFAGHGSSQALRFISNLILTRLLVPDLFGLMAIVTVFIRGLTLFSDIGIKPSIIQNPRGEEPNFLNTAWTLQVLRGFGLWLCCLIIAWPVARFYGNEDFLWLVPVVGLNTIVSGFNSTSLATLNRKLDLGKLTVFQSGLQIFQILITIVWAWFSPTIWALVGGSLITAFVKMLWSHRLISDMRNRFCWDKEAVEALFSFGRWVFISTALTFLGTQADRLILGKLFSLEILGIYTVAFTLSNMPLEMVKKVSGAVLFPVISQRADLPRETLREKIIQKRWLLLIGLAAGLSVLVGFGDLLILALYDERYANASWMLTLLAIGIWPGILLQTINASLIAVGKPIYRAFATFFRVIFMLVGVPLGAMYGGILGAIVVVMVNDLPTYLVINYGLWREKLSGLAQDFQATLLFAGLVALMLFGRSLLGFDLPMIGNL